MKKTWCRRTMGSYTDVRKTATRIFAGKWMQLEITMSSKRKKRFRKISHLFSHEESTKIGCVCLYVTELKGFMGKEEEILREVRSRER